MWRIVSKASNIIYKIMPANYLYKRVLAYSQIIILKIHEPMPILIHAILVTEYLFYYSKKIYI
jgi:hypothetical protein